MNGILSWFKPRLSFRENNLRDPASIKTLLISKMFSQDTSDMLVRMSAFYQGKMDNRTNLQKTIHSFERYTIATASDHLAIKGKKY